MAEAQFDVCKSESSEDIGTERDFTEAYSFFEAQQAIVKPGRRRITMYLSAAMIVVSAVVAIAGVFWVGSKFSKHFLKEPFVYFELKAIDGDGHPVAGADVWIENNRKGITDSFGEWRRYIRMQAGSSLQVRMKKDHQGQSLETLKNIVVPISSREGKKSLEVSGTITLLDPSRPVSYKDGAVAKVKRDKMEDLDRSEISKTVDDAANAEFQESLFGFDRIAVSFIETPMVRTNGLGINRQNFLRKDVMASVQRYAITNGIAIDSKSPWKLTVKHLSSGKGKSLIQVTTSFPRGSETGNESFLKNYMKTADLTADRIFSTLKMHIPRPYLVLHEGSTWFAMQPKSGAVFWKLASGDRLIGKKGKIFRLRAKGNYQDRIAISSPLNPCKNNVDTSRRCVLHSSKVSLVSPRVGWRKLKVKFSNAELSNSDLYFSGYKGTQLTKNVWSYWGPTQGGSNVTMLKRGRVFYRARVANSRGKVALVSLPRPNLARR